MALQTRPLQTIPPVVLKTATDQDRDSAVPDPSKRLQNLTPPTATIMGSVSIAQTTAMGSSFIAGIATISLDFKGLESRLSVLKTMAGLDSPAEDLRRTGSITSVHTTTEVVAG